MFARACLIVLIALGIGSCIDGHEEIWIGANGSGRAKFRYEFPASALGWYGGEAAIRRELDALITKNDDLEFLSYTLGRNDDRIILHINAGFDSPWDLTRFSTDWATTSDETKSAASPFAGENSLELRGRFIRVHRIMDWSKALPGAAFVPASRWQGHKLITKVHLPLPAAESNATRSENGGRTLIWETAVAEAIRQPIDIRFTAPVPLRNFLTPVLILVAAIVAVIFFVVYRTRRNRRLAS
ncbi:MAG: hypothetical protein V4733_03960 [Verrucomicrobiota bacterium]